MTFPAFKANDRIWILPFLMTAAILFSIPFMPEVVAMLSKVVPFAALTNWIVVVFIFYLIASRIAQSPGKMVQKFLSALRFTAVLMIVGFCLWQIRVPIEKIHVIEYGILAILFHRAFDALPGSPATFVKAGVVSAFVGTIDELIQSISPGRYFQMADILLNWAGTLLGLWIRQSCCRAASGG